MKIKQKLFYFIGSNKNNFFLKFFGKFFKSYLDAISNQNNDPIYNGEFWFLNQIKNCKNINVIFDVGANVGKWSIYAADLFTDAKIYSFEPDLNCCYALEKIVKDLNLNITVSNFGLFSINQQIKFYSNAKKSIFNSIYKRVDVEHVNPTFANFKRGEEFLIENGIECVDFLKIDVEGGEYEVLRGFDNFLFNKKVRIIQFEYGPMNIESRTLLKDFFSLLIPLGYKIGKLFPNSIEFEDYSYKIENFQWANYIAILETEMKILK